MKYLFPICPLLCLMLVQGAMAQNDSKSDSAKVSLDKTAMAEEVRQEFLHAWNGYKEYAWGHDELKPLSKSFHDWYGTPLLITAIDALDALMLMHFDAEADTTREYIVKHLSFDHDIEVKNFEIVIRILGGLLSSYQMSNDDRLLHLAEDLGGRLLPVFNSPTGMPYRYVNLKTGAVRGEVTNPAEIGTLLIEFGTLSKLTSKPVFYDKAKAAVVALFKRRSPLGLVGSQINVETGEWVDSSSHISGGIDSYYEYLLKSSKLFDDKDCESMWKASVDAINKHLADSTSSGLWYSVVDMYSGKRTMAFFGALDAFFPGVLALSGDLDRGGRFLESCYKIWTKFGIEPEGTNYSTMEVIYPGYPLRPEIIESTYYLYYYTHDPHYLKMGQTYLESLRKYCRTETGYAALKDVQTWVKSDEMPSFFLAETLKYLYLLFAPTETLDLKQTVFNTEAHPIRKSW